VRGRLAPEEADRPALAVCHVFPDCWPLRGGAAADDAPHGMDVPGCPCPDASAGAGAAPVAYKVGRSMFETAGLPAHLVEHANAMDELWVPSAFNAATFRAAGVTAPLRVVRQGVNTSYFDPARHTPLELRSLGAAQVTGPRDGDDVAVAVVGGDDGGGGGAAAAVKTASVEAGRVQEQRKKTKPAATTTKKQKKKEKPFGTLYVWCFSIVCARRCLRESECSIPDKKKAHPLPPPKKQQPTDKKTLNPLLPQKPTTTNTHTRTHTRT
jgi:hypothetical protein